MRKVLAMVMATLMMMSVVAPAVQARESGGVAGFFVGCCFGLRTGADFNDGKNIHWREIMRLVPVASTVAAIWDGIDIAGGMGRAELQQAYPGNYY